jgi:hypothetical protein
LALDGMTTLALSRCDLHALDASLAAGRQRLTFKVCTVADHRS